MLQTFTVKEETIDDALAAIELLRSIDGVDAERIFVLGHSLGGMLAPRMATHDSRIAGLIILAGVTRSLADLVLEQTIYLASLDGTIDSDEAAGIEEIRGQGERVKKLEISDGELVLGAPKTYWQDLAGYNPAAMAQSLTVPMLILQGERDYQVTMVDFKGWTDALQKRDNITLKSYPALNHLFISGSGKSTPIEYKEPGNVAQVVIEDIAAWIKSRS